MQYSADLKKCSTVIWSILQLFYTMNVTSLASTGLFHREFLPTHQEAYENFDRKFQKVNMGKSQRGNSIQ